MKVFVDHNNEIVATHGDDQNITLKDYPTASKIVTVDSSCVVWYSPPEELGEGIPSPSKQFFSEDFDLTSYIAVSFVSSVKAECGKRITSVVDATAQANLLAAAVAGILSEEEMVIYKTGVIGINSMRATCSTLIELEEEDYTNDEHWPEVSEDVVALANKY